MYSDLITAIEQTDVVQAELLLKSLRQDAEVDAWSIHEALFEVSLRVLNPPFINPHLPKMYAIDRELSSHLKQPDLDLLLQVEVREFTQRSKLSRLGKPADPPKSATFKEIEEGITRRDVPATAMTMSGFLKANGTEQFAGRLLLLGSGYLGNSLGHSISCTAFILLEMLQRKDQDPWPVLALLADYFCKGDFNKTPKLQYSSLSDYRELYLTYLKTAVSGTGIVALHHTITLYAIERCRHLFSHQEYDHLLTMWTKMMSSKQATLFSAEEISTEPLPGYDEFFSIFSRRAPRRILGMVKDSLDSETGRFRLSHFLTKGVLHSYDGSYNPHYLTGLGSALWLLESFKDQPTIVLNGMLQYLDFFFSGIRREG